MVPTDNHLITNDAAKYILTLRYDPRAQSASKSLKWNNFAGNTGNISSDFIEKSITDKIKTMVKPDTDKVCISLSGGIDSTLVLALLRKTYPNLDIHAFTVTFSDSDDEAPLAAAIAEKFDAKHKIIFLKNYLSDLPKAISITGQPFWDLHWYYIANNVKSTSQYIISGDGGDELFGGYTFRYSKFLSLVNNDSTPLEKTKAYLQCHERDYVPDQEDIFGERSNFSWTNVHSLIQPYFDNSLSPLSQVFLADYNGKMTHNFIPVNSTINSHFNLIGVAPILNDTLTESATQLHHSKKYDPVNDIGKLPLRKLLDELGATNLLNNKKMGFSVNTVNLWNLYGKDICRQYLDNSFLVEDKFISKNWIKKYIEKPDLDVRYVNKFLGLLAYEIWYRIFVVKEMSPNVTLK